MTKHKVNFSEIKQKLNEKLGEYSEEINNEDVFNYIFFIVYQRKKSKEDLQVDLQPFFEESTLDFVNWSFNLRFHHDKPVKCRFFPDCTNSNCLYFHPTQKCTFYPNCKYGKSCSFIHEGESRNSETMHESSITIPRKGFNKK